MDIQHRFKANDIVLVPSGRHAIVCKELDAILEYYRGVWHDAAGNHEAGRRILERLIDENRLKVVTQDAHAVVLRYQQPTSEMLVAYSSTPWSRLVRIRLLDGEAPGLEIWTDDGFLDKVEPKPLSVTNINHIGNRWVQKKEGFGANPERITSQVTPGPLRLGFSKAFMTDEDMVAELIVFAEEKRERGEQITYDDLPTVVDENDRQAAEAVRGALMAIF